MGGVMRGGVLGFVLLAGCAVEQLPPAEQCRAAFQDFDRVLTREPPLGLGFPGFDEDEAVSGVPVTRLRQFDCITFPATYPEPVVDRASLTAPALAPVTARTYVHVATLATDGLAGRLSDDLQSLDWPVEGRGAPGVGRRIFIGPIAEVDQALAIQAATGLGFPAAYGLNRIP